MAHKTKEKPEKFDFFLTQTNRKITIKQRKVETAETAETAETSETSETSEASSIEESDEEML